MGELYTDFQNELTQLERKFVGQPIKEIVTLLLIAIEREQLVSVAYRDDLMAQRIERMEIPDEARDLIRQSLKWAWKEEQMHAIYSRGLLFKLGGAGLRSRALKLQLEGAIGGWAASTKNHIPFRRAPIARSVAGLLTSFGTLSGKVPRAVRKSLKYLSFREYCAMQVDAELTAAAAWKRMYELAVDLDDPRIDQEVIDAFHQMWIEEERHRIVFEAIGGALNDDDRLIPDALEPLREKIVDVGDFFLPREMREHNLARHPVGNGGTVVIADSEQNDKKEDVFESTCRRVDLERTIAEACRKSGNNPGELNVVIKATFMLGYDRRDSSVITDPELVQMLVSHLRQLGVEHISVGDGGTLYDHFFNNRSVAKVADYFGYGGDYELIDFGADQTPHGYARGMGQSTISKRWRDADVRIFFSKLRSHPVDFAHIGLGAAQGLGERFEQYLFLERQADRETALFMPITDFPPHLTFVDAFDSAGDGVIGMLSCPDGPSPKRVYAARDLLALDIVASRHIGLRSNEDSRFLQLAHHWFGDPSEVITVDGEDRAIEPWRSPIANPWRAFLSATAFPVWQLFGFRGALFLPPMDEEAFPPKRKHGVVFRFVRGVIRRIIGMKVPK